MRGTCPKKFPQRHQPSTRQAGHYTGIWGRWRRCKAISSFARTAVVGRDFSIFVLHFVQSAGSFVIAACFIVFSFSALGRVQP
jgi:hypothetical protein